MIIKPLKMWVQNILPVVYDDSLSYLEMVAKINAKTNEIIDQTNENTAAIEALNEVISQLGDVDELRALLDEVEAIVDDLYTTDVPLMNGTASAGSADHAARSDHIHPHDTGLLSDDTPVIDGTASAGIADEAARSDHVHPHDTGLLSNALPLNDGVASAGTSTSASRSDHVHKNIESWNGKKILIIGDSWAAGSTNGGSFVTTPWPNSLCENLGAIGTIVKQSGGGLAIAGGQNNTTWPGETIVEALNHYNDEYDCIVIQTGWNDINGGPTAAQVKTAIEALKNLWKTKFTKAKLYVIPSYPPKTFNSTNYTKALSLISNCIEAGIYCCPYSLHWLIYNKSHMSSDNIHPTQDGYNLWAKYAEAFLNGWDGLLHRSTAQYHKATDGTVTGSLAVDITVNDTNFSSTDVYLFYNGSSVCIQAFLNTTDSFPTSGNITVLSGLPFPKITGQAIALTFRTTEDKSLPRCIVDGTTLKLYMRGDCSSAQLAVNGIYEIGEA